MFFYTAKFSKKKAIAIVLGIAVLLCIIVILAASFGGKDKGVSGSALKTNEDRITYLNSLGWEVEVVPLEVQNIVIPREFGDVYSEYIELQRRQGYSLEKYGGMEAVRYTYRITNYPDGNTEVVADMVLYNAVIIAGDIQCTAADGFMKELKPAAERTE